MRDELSKIVCPDCNDREDICCLHVNNNCKILSDIINLFTGKITGEMIDRLTAHIDGVLDISPTELANAINEKLRGE